MTPDELRALADALIRHADYLRQCADAKPGAWLVTGGRLYEDVPCTSLEYAELRQRDRDDGSQIIQLYTHPAPAAPPPLQNTVPLDSLLRRNERDPQRAALMAEARLAAAPAAPQAMEDANVWKQIVPDDAPQAEPEEEACADAKPVAIVGEQRNGAWAGTNTPVGYVWSPPSDNSTKMLFPLADLPLGTKLYAHPAPAAPHPAVQAGWKLVPVEPTPEMLDEGCDVDARAEVIKKYAAMPVIRNPENYCSCGEMLAVQYRAMIAAAPAAPQAEPIDPHMIVADDRFPDEQAEPKREPNPDEVICPACTHQFRAIPENVQAQLWAKREPLSDTMVIACARVAIARIQPDEWVATDADLIDFARAIESEHGIGGSDAE